jgi:Lamin Tail Domain
MWFPQGVETDHNAAYHVLSARAALAGTRIWNTEACGVGPQQDAHIGFYLHYHANGSSTKNPNGQWIQVVNNGPTTLHLGGWHLRDTSLAMFTFPAKAEVPPGDTVTVHVGRGTNVNSTSARTFYWELDKPIFGEVHRSTGQGDEAILLDPQGDFRAWMDYPCVVACADPLQGHLAITSVHATDPESVTLQSANTYDRIDLSHYQIRSWPWNYVFPPGSYLDPGETLTVYTGSGTSTRLTQYMGESSAGILRSAGDVVDISNLRDTQIACHAWGGATCDYDY